jgi:hypothetical protein
MVRVLETAAVLDPEVRYDFISPMPYSSNIEIGADGELAPRLSLLSRMAIDAAAIAWRANPEATVITAGETCYGSELPDTPSLLFERALTANSVPATALKLLFCLKNGRTLDNTYLQLRGLRDFVQRPSPANLLVLPLGYHAERVQEAAEALSLEVDIVVVEDVLKMAGNTEYAEAVACTSGLAKSERLLRRLQPLSPKGGLFNLITRATGPRLVDVVQDSDGSFILEQGLARTKKRQLQRASGRQRSDL